MQILQTEEMLQSWHEEGRYEANPLSVLKHPADSLALTKQKLITNKISIRLSKSVPQYEPSPQN